MESMIELGGHLRVQLPIIRFEYRLLYEREVWKDPDGAVIDLEVRDDEMMIRMRRDPEETMTMIQRRLRIKRNLLYLDMVGRQYDCLINPLGAIRSTFEKAVASGADPTSFDGKDWGVSDLFRE
ncbi:hypothetical protein Hanom_Chr15g01385281 [Helianthus anomalus]